MANNQKTPLFPRNVLIIAGTVILLAIMTAAAGRITHAANSAPTAAQVSSRDLLFHDRPNGAVAVFDAADPSAPIDVLAPATNGFLRATMRGLAQQRIRPDADRISNRPPKVCTRTPFPKASKFNPGIACLCMALRRASATASVYR
jgi:hypothetical protein